ncbi:MAG: LysM peptidoglycan-binding domain-containing protein [Bacteroidetes bacterium]|nr:LysM peptidoglycan-binding domain-containing protein [Bacteroidota bacterium]
MIKFPKYVLLLSIFTLIILPANSQKLNTSAYIEKYKNLAINEMKTSDIPASIILAQGILESGNGNSQLAKRGKNHFGIKCHNTWDGRTIRWDDDAKRECFRKYNSVADSYRDHSEFLKTRGHYSFLFNLKITDYKAWARGLQKAGYATNKKYATLLIRIIEENNLQKYDDKKLLANTIAPESDSREIDPNIRMPDESGFEPIDIGNSNRKLYTNNGVKFIFANTGDTFTSIARDLNIYSWQVYKYNELKKDDILKAGQVLYVEKKKRRNTQKFHMVKPNETLYSISQLYGIQLKVLCKKNKMSAGDNLNSGQQLKLK